MGMGGAAQRPRVRKLALALAIALGLGASVLSTGLSPDARAEDALPATTNGKSSGLAVPRFVSLKSNKVNVRRGPSTDQSIVWVFARAGLPVEVIAEFENWRRVRDSEGADGWVYHSLLSGRRTVLISPWAKGTQSEGKQSEGKRSVLLHAGRSASSGAVAKLQPGVIGDIVGCDGQWCELSVNDFSGYVPQEKLWGVYRNETIE